MSGSIHRARTAGRTTAGTEAVGNVWPEAPPSVVPELLTTKQAAELLSVGERTLWRHSRHGIAPKPVRVGGAVRYRRSELMAWVDAGCPRVDGE